MGEITRSIGPSIPLSPFLPKYVVWEKGGRIDEDSMNILPLKVPGRAVSGWWRMIRSEKMGGIEISAM